MRVHYYCLQKLKISTRVSGGVSQLLTVATCEYVCRICTWRFVFQKGYSVKVNVLYLTFVY